MGRYRQGIALGIIIGAGAVLCLVSFLHLDLFSFQTFCKTDERAGSCVREWFAASAGVAAFFTIVLLLRDQAFTREVAILQTLDVRARFVTGRRVARRLRYLAGEIKMSGFRWENPRHKRPEPIKPANLVSKLIKLEKVFFDDAIWDRIADFDHRIVDEKNSITVFVTDLLHTFLNENLEYARNLPTRLKDEFVQDHWHEDINAREVINLSYRVENLSKRIDTLADELSNFRGSRYFREKEVEQRGDAADSA